MNKPMNNRNLWLTGLGVMLVAGLAGLGCYSCSSQSYEGKIVAVEQADGGLSGEGATLVVLDPEKPGDKGKVLLKEFQSACAPSLSHDGRYLVFQGKEKAGDPWQIWVLDMKKGSRTRITQLEENCTSPLVLPDLTVLFSREETVKGKQVMDLWRSGMDGCCLTRVTFDPSKNRCTGILQEGRVLYSSTQEYPESREAVLMVMRPDGTKAEVYTPGGNGMVPVSGGSESSDGHVYFISGTGKLSRVLHHRPLHTFEDLSGDLAGRFASVRAVQDGRILVSYRPSGNEAYGIYTFMPGSGDAPSLLFSGEKDLTDPLLIPHPEGRPRILPSAVNPGNPTGLLMSQDINHSMLPVHEGIRGDTLASRIRISTLEGELAVVEVKEDGSFYLKLDADTPFRMEALNSQGETLRGPSDWIYLRPGERRACTGCHADPELAPENIQPLAVREDPAVLATITQ
jgi:hypothetical protein